MRFFQALETFAANFSNGWKNRRFPFPMLGKLPPPHAARGEFHPQISQITPIEKWLILPDAFESAQQTARSGSVRHRILCSGDLWSPSAISSHTT